VSWWREGVLYQIYPRSFADSNGDGIGDIPGIVARLDYLAWLGIDGIWLNPTYPSPNVDWGYDVSDYLGVHPDLGTLADLDRLIAEAKSRGIHVVLDLVPNHTSNRHPWFRERPEYYVWADGVPNNWRSIFGGPAWDWDDDCRAYFLHNFAEEQPDLDWWNDDVRDEFDRILRFWFDRGVAGFRIDVAHAIVKDRLLRDDPIDPADFGGRRHIHSMRRPEVHDVHRRWRRIADEYDEPRLLLGEAYLLDLRSGCASTATGTTSSTSRSTSPSCTRSSTPDRCGRSSRRQSGSCPRARRLAGPGRITTGCASRRAGATATRHSRAACS
jgi:alpha-glucosidase